MRATMTHVIAAALFAAAIIGATRTTIISGPLDYESCSYAAVYRMYGMVRVYEANVCRGGQIREGNRVIFEVM